MPTAKTAKAAWPPISENKAMSRAGVIASYINNNFISHLLDVPHAASTALKH
jgi:hypothetical protein